MTSAATAPKRRQLMREVARGGVAFALDTDVTEGAVVADWFPVTKNAISKPPYDADLYFGTRDDSNLFLRTHGRSHTGIPVIKARVSGHYYTPEAALWRDVSSGSNLGLTSGPTIAWVDLSDATTWEGPLEANDPDNFLDQSVGAQVQTAIRGARGEHFESGYESQFRKTLGRMYRVLGSRVVETVCDELAKSGIGDEILAQAFKFLVDVRDPGSRDLRLVTIAQFLRSYSALTRDAAATALSALDDARAVAYLRDAAGKESHPFLKYEFLEIAADLEAE